MNIEPITEDAIADLRQQAMEAGLSKQQVVHLLRQLSDTERERARLEREVNNLHVGRMALRETLMTELGDGRKQLADTTGRLAAAQEASSLALAALKREEVTWQDIYTRLRGLNVPHDDLRELERRIVEGAVDVLASIAGSA